MPRGSSERQRDLFTQLAEARTPEERDRIVRRMRHAEVGQEGERGRVLDGLIVNGRDPYADLRGGARPVYDDAPPHDEIPHKEIQMTAQPTMQQLDTRTQAGSARRLDQIQPQARETGNPKRKSPVWPDRRHEIIYCPECRRQYQASECEIETVDLVMTTHGGMTSTTVRCKTHNIVIALKTEFIIRAKRAEPAS